jgi:hypothetical protein
MAHVLVAGAIIQCSHSGQLRMVSGDSRLTVDQNGVVTSGMERGLAFGAPPPANPVPGMISPCSAVVKSSGTPAPCVTGPAASGQSLLLSVGNLPVLLDTANGPTVTPSGPATWSVSSAGQTKLEST